MRRILGAAVILLLLLVTAWVVCQDRRTDEMPTQRFDPKELPQPVHYPGPD